MRPRRAAIADRHMLLVGLAGLLGAIVLLMLVVFGSRGRVSESRSTPAISRELLDADVSERDPSKRVLIGESQKASGDPLGALQTGRGELEFTNDQGLLALRYRWDKSDPLETGWNRFTNPQAWIYRTENQLIYIRAEEGQFLLADNRQPQVGVLAGNVVVSLFESAGRRGVYSIDVGRDVPVAEFSTSSFSFDAVRLSGRTEDRVVVRTADVILLGTGLNLLFNERLGRIEELDIAQRELIVYRRDGAADSGAAASIRPRGAEGGAASAPPSAASAGGGRGEPRSAELLWRDVTPYRLTLTDEVIITQGEGKDQLRVVGRDLAADFAVRRGEGGGQLTGAPSSRRLDGGEGGGDRPLAPAPGPDPRVASIPMLLASMRLAAVPILPTFLGSDRGPAAGDIHITGGGSLNLIPLDGTPRQLHDPDDLHATLHGDPVRVDFGSFYAIGTELVYSRAEAVARLLCTRDQPLEAGVPGEARLTSVFPFEYQFDPLASTGATRGVLQGAGTIVGLAPREPAPPWLEPQADRENPMRGLPVGFSVNWLDDFTIEFKGVPEGGGLGRIAAAVFNGTVHVDDPEGYSLDSQQLRIDFKDRSGTREQIVDSITASGDASLRSAEGNVSGDELFVLFRENARGSSSPSQMTVTGSGRVADADGSLEAQYIQADLVEESLAQQEALPRGFGGSAAFAVSNLLAQGAVVLSFADGVRALADRLVADARTDKAVLTGEQVIVSDPTLNVIGRHAEITNVSTKDGERTARFIGAGTLTYFEEARKDAKEAPARDEARPMLTPEEMREELRRRLEGGSRDDAPAPPTGDASPAAADPGGPARNESIGTVTVEWADHLTFEEGPGRITFEGDVEAVSEPSPQEIDRIAGQWMRIELTELMKPAGDPQGRPVRRMRKITVLGRGDEPAQVEAQRFADGARTQREMLLAIASEIIEYTDATELFEAIGDGWMLIVDSGQGSSEGSRNEGAQGGGTTTDATAPTAQVAAERDPSAAAVKFSGPGETDFSWTGRLSLQGGSGLMVISDDVLMRHRPLNEPVIRVDSNRMTAVLRSADALGALDLSRREGMDLTHAVAEGDVFIRRLDRSIWADRLSYDRKSLLATIECFDNNYVLLESASTGGAVQARRVLWDFFTNSITVEGTRVDAPMPAIRE